MCEMEWPAHVVQIAHGLGEHIGRYAELAEILVRAEFVVYGNDHRGHGLTAKPTNSFGDFGQGGFDQLVKDMATLRYLARNEYPGKPYILLGHSMGSFAAQQFILDHSHSIDGLVLSGSGALDCLARTLQAEPAGENPMKLMNTSFEPSRTPFDWLSRDEDQVDAFIDGPFNIPDLMQLYELDRPELKDPPLQLSSPSAFAPGEQLFPALKRQDVLLHHPYTAYATVTSFINAAPRPIQMS